jgi:hypothetical protein
MTFKNCVIDLDRAIYNFCIPAEQKKKPTAEKEAVQDERSSDSEDQFDPKFLKKKSMPGSSQGIKKDDSKKGERNTLLYYHERTTSNKDSGN